MRAVVEVVHVVPSSLTKMLVSLLEEDVCPPTVYRSWPIWVVVWKKRFPDRALSVFTKLDQPDPVLVEISTEER